MSVLTERYGPLPGWGWGIAGGGALVVTIIVLRSKKSASTTSPNAGTTAANLNSSGGPTTGDLLSGNYSAGQGSSLFNGSDSIMSTLQGIEQQLAGSASTTAVLPPPTSSGPTPLPVSQEPAPVQGQLPGFLTGTGLLNIVGNVVGSIEEGPGGGAVYATDQGAVYAVGGAQYYGGTNQHPEWNAGRIVGIQPLAGGGYSLINYKGQTYNFPAH